MSYIGDVLRNSPRCGAEVDEPEGARYIMLSDSLANKLADVADAIAVLNDSCSAGNVDYEPINRSHR